MLDAIYHFLKSIGYPHPLHPALTHMPIGLVVGALVFAWIAWAFRRDRLALTARHCLLLALFFLFPAVLAGLMDWQYFYAGAWLTIFKLKMVLAGVLLILLVLGAIFSRKDERRYGILLPIYTLCFFTVVVLGYLGGQLVFGGMTPAVTSKELSAGADIFKSKCAACHPRGGNVINPKLPLIGASQLANPGTFLAFVRNPVRPDGSRGAMPPFPGTRVSDQQTKELYDYITRVLEKSGRK